MATDSGKLRQKKKLKFVTTNIDLNKIVDKNWPTWIDKKLGNIHLVKKKTASRCINCVTQEFKPKAYCNCTQLILKVNNAQQVLYPGRYYIPAQEGRLSDMFFPRWCITENVKHFKKIREFLENQSSRMDRISSILTTIIQKHLILIHLVLKSIQIHIIRYVNIVNQFFIKI